MTEDAHVIEKFERKYVEQYFYFIFFFLGKIVCSTLLLLIINYHSVDDLLCVLFVIHIVLFRRVENMYVNHQQS